MRFLFAVVLVASTLPTAASAATIALVNSPTGNASFVSNLQALVEARGDVFVRNPTSFAGVDTVINVRAPVSADLATFVLNGGALLTEYSGIREAGLAGLIDYRDSGGSNAGTGTSITFTPTGVSAGLTNGLSNPFSDGGATEFFRNGIVIGSDVTVFATRGAGIPAILGAAAGDGYVLGLAFDWGDGLIGNSVGTRTLVGNALDFVGAQSAVPEPGTWLLMIAGFALIGGMVRRARTYRSTPFALPQARAAV